MGDICPLTKIWRQKWYYKIAEGIYMMIIYNWGTLFWDYVHTSNYSHLYPLHSTVSLAGNQGFQAGKSNLIVEGGLQGVLCQSLRYPHHKLVELFSAWW